MVCRVLCVAMIYRRKHTNRHGKIHGTLAGVSAMDLGAYVVKEVLVRASIPADAIEEVIMGNVISAFYKANFKGGNHGRNRSYIPHQDRSGKRSHPKSHDPGV